MWTGRKGAFRPYQPPEPQPRGAVTRRAVAQRRSRASGLTRPLLVYVGGLGEVSRVNVGALGERGPKECWCFRRGKLPLSHKPVEIGDFRAQSDSRGGEAGEGPGLSAEALRGDPRGGKGLFSEMQGARDGLSSGGASPGTGGISGTTDRRCPPAQTCRGRPRIAKTWRGCRRSQGSPCLRPRCGLSAFFPSNLAVFGSTEAAPPCGAPLPGLPESYWASRSGAATGAIAGVEGKRIKTPRPVV